MTIIVTLALAVLVACISVCLYRIAVGPHSLDRVLAFDLVGALVALALAVFAVVQQSWVYLEISMGLAVLSFVGTLAMAYYIERGRIF